MPGAHSFLPGKQQVVVSCEVGMPERASTHSTYGRMFSLKA